VSVVTSLGRDVGALGDEGCAVEVYGRQPVIRLGGRTVGQYAGELVRGCSVAGALAVVGRRVAGHDDVGGFCGNGCKVRGWRGWPGWQEPFPCPTRLFYEAVRDHVLSMSRRDAGGESAEAGAESLAERA
jgi:hypothetical protein